ncbi:co-chaperone YbbN [Tersicoccus solisilvae]|uniref:Co-chaperone YbbN n=1 Tax=Tersicoccus solisilvae TaxID=1882339 RepID=A0ABQ1P633_9MICC|nr:tetratricopeptide repeat protein [Tersicoccus solisilvae]GGC91935.1 co-chaperone YbbN [Tersicoccus solisilvae]
MTTPRPGSPVPSSMNLRGAVDLSALKARAQRPESAAGTPGAAGSGAGAGAGAGASTPSPWVVEGSDARINQLAQLSGQVPVILQLWSSASEMSQQMLDLMGERVHARGGRLALATIDIDANPQITQAFAVQGVPATFALIKGQPVPLFTGAQPASQIDAFFDELLQVAQANGVTGTLGGEGDEPGDEPTDAEPALPPLHQEAVDAIDAGDYERAIAAYRRALAESPADADAAVGLAQVQLLQRLDGVDAAAVRAAAADRPDDLHAQLTVADLDLGGGHVEDAFSRLIGVVGRSAGDDREAARARLVELFDVVGATDPRVSQARSALARVLF